MKRFIVLSVLLITTVLIVSAQDSKRRGSGEKARHLNGEKAATRRQAIKARFMSRAKAWFRKLCLTTPWAFLINDLSFGCRRDKRS